jgi:hypothetical protein
MMQDLNQDDMDRLDRVAQYYKCEVSLPPYRGTNHPFICIRDVNEYDAYYLTATLIEKGFSFLSNDDGCIEIIGVNNDLYRL